MSKRCRGLINNSNNNNRSRSRSRSLDKFLIEKRNLVYKCRGQSSNKSTIDNNSSDSDEQEHLFEAARNNSEHQSELSSSNQGVIYKYEITFEPSIRSKLLKHTLLSSYDYIFNNCKAFDGISFLYALNKLENDETTFTTFVHNTNHRIKIQFFDTILPLVNESFNMFNLVTKRCLQSQYENVNTNFGRKQENVDNDEPELPARDKVKQAQEYKAMLDSYSRVQIDGTLLGNKCAIT
jgi:hypothetical protein